MTNGNLCSTFLLFLPVQQKSTDKDLKQAVIDVNVLDLPDLYCCDVFKGNSASKMFEGEKASCWKHLIRAWFYEEDRQEADTDVAIGMIWISSCSR